MADDSAADPDRSLAEHAIDELADAASQADEHLVLVLVDMHVFGDPEVIGTEDVVPWHPPAICGHDHPERPHDVAPPVPDPGNLSEIRAAELAMSVPEVEQLLAVHNLQLPADQVAMLPSGPTTPRMPVPLLPCREPMRWVMNRFTAVEFTCGWDVDVPSPLGELLVGYGPSCLWRFSLALNKSSPLLGRGHFEVAHLHPRADVCCLP